MAKITNKCDSDDAKRSRLIVVVLDSCFEMFRIAPSPTTIPRSLPLRHQFIALQFGSRPLSRRQALNTSKSVLEPPEVEQSEDSSVAAEAKYEPLTTQQVKELVTLVCKETKLAQLELKLGSFEVKIKRKGKIYLNLLFLISYF